MKESFRRPSSKDVVMAGALAAAGALSGADTAPSRSCAVDRPVASASDRSARVSPATQERLQVRMEKPSLPTEGEDFEDACYDVTHEVKDSFGELFPSELLDRLDRLANHELSESEAAQTRTELRVQIAEALLSTRERVQDEVRARVQEAFNKGAILRPADLVRYHSALENEVADRLLDELEPGEEHEGIMADLAFSEEAHQGLYEAFRTLYREADQREERFAAAARASQRVSYDAQGNRLDSSGDAYMFEDLRGSSPRPVRSGRGHTISTNSPTSRPRG